MRRGLRATGLACLIVMLALLSSSTMGADPVVEKGRARITGRVIGGGASVANATVALVEASAVAKSSSIQPVEDLAAATPFKGRTNAAGDYAVEAPSGRYFVYVFPPPGDRKHLPGGEASNRSVDLSAGGLAVSSTALSERPSPSATWVGTSKCLSCHVGLKPILETRHFNGLRMPGVPSPLMDFSHMRSVPAEPQFTGTGPQDTDGNGVNDFEQGMSLTIKKGTASLEVKLGYVDADKSGSLTNGDTLTATFGGKTYHIWFIDGAAGEGYENGKQRLTTKLDAQGTPIPRGDTTTPGSLYVMPFQLKEYRGADGKLHYKWDADVLEKWVDKSGAIRARPDATFNYDNKCMGCHAPVLALGGDAKTGFRALVPPDPAGQIVQDGVHRNQAITCERCHGPGSEHVAVGKGHIVNPKKLGPAARSMVCGQCHQRGDVKGEGRATVDGVWTMYPSRGKDGEFEVPRAGVNFLLPSDFYGQPNGDGILPDFGTKDRAGNAFLNPMDFRTDATHSWMEKAQGFGSKLNHSSWMHHDYMDHTRNRMYKNSVQLVGCADCHDPHSRENPRQLRLRTDNNALCLGCHNGENVALGEFVNVTTTMVDDLEHGRADARVLDTIAGDVMRHIRTFTFKATGLTMGLPISAYNPESPTMPVGSCVACHMPKVIGKNVYHYDAEGFLIEGDTRSHAFDVILPRVSRNMAAAGIPPIPNSCVTCHRGTDKVRFPDFRFKKGIPPGDREFVPAQGWKTKG